MSDKNANEFINVLSKLKDNLVKVGEDDYNDEDNQEYGTQDYALGEEDLANLNVVDDPFEESDEAAKWLKDKEEGGGQAKGSEEAPDEEEAPKAKKVSSSGYSDWAPQDNYSDEHQAAMKQHMDDGYSHREAERLAGAHKGPGDFQTALTHTVRPSQPSEKMLGELKDLAKPWLENADRHSKLNADPEKNPNKFAAGQMLQAHEEHSKDYNKDYHAFLGSDEVKDLKGRDRHKAVREWKGKWHGDNPEYKENVSNVSEAQKHYKEAGEARQKSLQERIEHITSGGIGAPIDMSMAEAAQHVGGVKTEEGYSATTLKDPSVSFAQQNPELLRVLKDNKASPDQMDRLNRINSAKASKDVKIIRRKGGA